ncbi:MAG: hypothetical protein R3F34_00420 [Planctomycetota bacterium]
MFRALFEAWSSAGAPERGWLGSFVAGADGRRRFGHPVLLGRGLAGEATALDPDAPLNRLREGADPLLAVEVASYAVLEDLDTPADLAELEARDAAERGR